MINLWLLEHKKIYALILNFNETLKVGAKFMELPTNLLGWL